MVKTRKVQRYDTNMFVVKLEKYKIQQKPEGLASIVTLPIIRACGGNRH